MGAPFLYLDVDESGVNAMIIEDSRKKQVIHDSCRILYDDLPDAGEDVAPFDAALVYIASCIRLSDCSEAVVVTSSPRISFRTLPLPFKSEKKIGQILPMEISIHLPLADESYVTDFKVPKIPGRRDQYPVLTASIPEPDIQKIFTGLTNLGLRPVIITPGGYASAVCFMQQHPDFRSFAFVDVGRREVSITLVEDQNPVMVRTFNIDSFNAAVIGAELKRTVMGYSHRTGSTTGLKVFVASFYTGLDHSPVFQALGDLTRHDVESMVVLDPADRLTGLSPNREISGLLNFCRDKFGKEGFLQQYLHHIVVSAVIGMAVFGVFMFSLRQDIQNLEAIIKSTEQETASIFEQTFPGKRNIGEPLLQMQSLVKEAQQKAGNAADSDQMSGKTDYSSVQVLFELSEKIPSTIDMEVTRLLLNNDRLTLSGSTDNFNTVDKIKSHLESSRIFKKVNITSAAADNNGSRILFKFLVELQ